MLYAALDSAFFCGSTVVLEVESVVAFWAERVVAFVEVEVVVIDVDTYF